MKDAKRRGGFTITEVAIAATILILIAGSLVTALDGLRGVTITGSSRAKLQAAGERALKSIIADVKRSGQATVGANTYPFIFEAGDAGVAIQETNLDECTLCDLCMQAFPGKVEVVKLYEE